MRPARKLLLAGVIVLAAVLLALPFRGEFLEGSGQDSDQVSQRRWRETRIHVPVPLRMQAGQSPAENLSSTPVDNPDDVARKFGPSIISPPVPPRIPATYQPLLEVARVDLDTARSRIEAGRTTATADQLAQPTAEIATNEEPPRENFRIVRHRIRDGDTLQRIASKYLGDGDRYLEIYEANKKRLPSAQILPLDVEIEVRIPR